MNERMNRTSRWVTVVILLLIRSRDYSRADFTFGEPTNLGRPVNSSYSDGLPSLSSDGLSLFFNSARSGGYGSYDLWVTTRAAAEDDWGTPTNLGATVNSSGTDGAPRISADDLSLYFSSDRGGGSGGSDIWVTTRETIHHDWGAPVNLGPTINSAGTDGGPSISADGLSLFFMSDWSGGLGGDDIWVTTRETIHHDWGTPVNLGPTVNSSSPDGFPSISPDGLLLFFGSYRAGGYGAVDLWVARRATTNDSWNTPVNLGPVINSSQDELAVCISGDWTTLFFSSRRPGGIGDQDIWQITIVPIVDFNGDGSVDVKDVVIMTEHWGEDYSFCDIGPTPLGDGIVDVQDLEILTNYIEPIDRTLIAHWALDETEGGTALDSAGDNLGYVMGNPIWQPDAGQVNGAIQLDGVDDVIVAGPPLNPIHGSLSVFAWIQGGAPGQAIISEPAGPDWLSLDPVTGHLMTELTNAGRSAAYLRSETVITDGDWHRIGFVWDGLYRTLYVDGVAVAEDTQDGLANSGNGFYIGCGKDMQPGTFFSGLIDDVQIYDRAVMP